MPTNSNERPLFIGSSNTHWVIIIVDRMPCTRYPYLHKYTHCPISPCYFVPKNSAFGNIAKRRKLISSAAFDLDRLDTLLGLWMFLVYGEHSSKSHNVAYLPVNNTCPISPRIRCPWSEFNILQRTIRVDLYIKLETYQSLSWPVVHILPLMRAYDFAID